MELPGDLDKKIAELSPAKRALLERLRSKSAEPPPITARPPGSTIPLSFAQRRLWFLYALNPASTLYNVPRALRLEGKLDAAALEQSLNSIAARHEVLRTSFRMTADGPVQVVASNLNIPLPVTDLSSALEGERTAILERLAVEEVQIPFDLGKGPVWRARLFRLSPEDHVLVMVLHHIVSDGWTGGILFDELGSLYDAIVRKRPSPLPEVSLQYADYAVWQRSWLESEALESQLAYWREQLKDTTGELNLPADYSRPSLASYRGATRAIVLGGQSEKIRAFSREHGTTVFTTMLAALNILLYRWTGQSDLVVGTITANRNQLQTERMVGCFMNFLPLRSRFREADSGAEILAGTKRTVLEAYAHQECPFERLIEDINPQRKL
ncbi:MAG TPA: condensation domain-containing protein, partial [Bryobacteraceae bacterium]|nr:condensation domain-containing protein [Bryobacteraceae bacterium]